MFGCDGFKQINRKMMPGMVRIIEVIIIKSKWILHFTDFNVLKFVNIIINLKRKRHGFQKNKTVIVSCFKKKL